MRTRPQAAGDDDGAQHGAVLAPCATRSSTQRAQGTVEQHDHDDDHDEGGDDDDDATETDASDDDDATETDDSDYEQNDAVHDGNAEQNDNNDGATVRGIDETDDAVRGENADEDDDKDEDEDAAAAMKSKSSASQVDATEIQFAASQDVPLDEWQALAAKGLAEHSEEMVEQEPSLKKHHANSTSLDLDMGILSLRTKRKWVVGPVQRPKAQKERQEKQRVDQKREKVKEKAREQAERRAMAQQDRDEVEGDDEAAKTCISICERTMLVDKWKTSYICDVGDGLILLASATCLCSLEKTHCLGCALRVDGIFSVPVTRETRHLSLKQRARRCIRQIKQELKKRKAKEILDKIMSSNKRLREETMTGNAKRQNVVASVQTHITNSGTHSLHPTMHFRRQRDLGETSHAHPGQYERLAEEPVIHLPRHASHMCRPPVPPNRLRAQTAPTLSSRDELSVFRPGLYNLQPQPHIPANWQHDQPLFVGTRPSKIPTPASLFETRHGHKVHRAAHIGTRSARAQLTSESRASTPPYTLDYYELLQVPRSASDQEIKKAYRELVMKFHPDKNKHNPVEAQHKLQEISEAYDVFSDPQKRVLFDQYGYDGLKNGVPDENGDMRDGYAFNERASEKLVQKFFGSDNPFNDFGFGNTIPFRSDLRKSSAEKAPVITQDVACSLEELFSGVTKSFAVTRTRLQNDELAEESKTFQIKVKAGWKHGTKITFEWKASPTHEVGESRTHEVGDVVFQIVQQKHAHYTRDGANLIYKANIKLSEALGDYGFEVPTLDGRKLAISCNEVISPSSEKLVKGEGMPIASNPTERGDLVIKFDIQFPKHLTNLQKQALAKIVG